MDGVHPRLTAALARQLTRRDAALAQGARRVGWKLGVGDAERIGEGPAVGHLTSATQLIPGSTYEAATRLHVDVELAVEIGSDGEVSRCASALELVDLSGLEDDAEEIVAANLFHRAFALGRFGPPADGVVRADLIVDGETRGSGLVEDVTVRIDAAARVLASVDEELREGDHVITGAIVQLPVEPGQTVVAELGPLGSVGVRLGGNAAQSAATRNPM
jgi:2-keto-4-pentenoate hydratase